MTFLLFTIPWIEFLTEPQNLPNERKAVKPDGLLVRVDTVEALSRLRIPQQFSRRQCGYSRCNCGDLLPRAPGMLKAKLMNGVNMILYESCRGKQDGMNGINTPFFFCPFLCMLYTFWRAFPHIEVRQKSKKECLFISLRRKTVHVEGN